MGEQRDFGYALKLMRSGCKVRREVWGDGTFAFIYRLETGDEIISRQNNNGSFWLFWRVSQKDLLATDWDVVE